MKKMNRLLSRILILALFVCLVPMKTFAGDGITYKQVISSYNEWDIVETLENSAPEELRSMGLSTDEVDRTIDIYYEALKKRAMEPDDVLKAMGYSREQINGLRRVAKGEKLNSTEIKGITATFYDYCSFAGVNSNRYATMSYSWVWSSCPLITIKDSAAVIWRATKSDGVTMNLIKYNQSSQIDYCVGNQIVKTVKNSTIQPMGMDGINVQFNMSDYVGSNYYAWAKYGTVTVYLKVDDSVSGTFSYIEFFSQYAHTTLGWSFPSASFSPTGFDISFTPELCVSEQGGRHVKYYSPQNWDYLP